MPLQQINVSPLEWKQEDAEWKQENTGWKQEDAGIAHSIAQVIYFALIDPRYDIMIIETK